MNKDEIEKWNMIDIGGYNTSLSIFDNYLYLIENNINTREYSLLEFFLPMRDRLDRLSSRFSDMDLDCLEYKYPIDQLGTIKYVLLPEMDKHFCLLEKLIKQFDIQSDTSIVSQILDCVKVCDTDNDRLRYFGKQINNCPEYLEYRNSAVNRKYIY